VKAVNKYSSMSRKRRFYPGSYHYGTVQTQRTSAIMQNFREAVRLSPDNVKILFIKRFIINARLVSREHRTCPKKISLLD